MGLRFDYKDLTSANEFSAFKFWKAYINTTKQEDPERYLKQKVGRSIFRYMQVKLGHTSSVFNQIDRHMINGHTFTSSPS